MATEKAFLYNDSQKEYDYEIKGTRYRIPAGGHIILPRAEAAMVVGFKPPTAMKDTPIMLRRELVARNPESYTRQKFVCNLCGLEFDTQVQLDSHMEKIHGVSDVPSDNKKKVYVCWCGKEITGSLGYSQHKAMHERKGEGVNVNATRDIPVSSGSVK